MARTLASFSITPAAEGYEIQFEDEDGETQELIASLEQLDLMIEEIDRIMALDDGEPLDDDADEADAED